MGILDCNIQLGRFDTLLINLGEPMSEPTR